MWTLVLFTLFGNPNSGGGTYANVSTFQFSTEKYCLEAAKTRSSGDVRKLGTNILPNLR